MKNKNLIITVVIVIAAAAAGFFGGMKYQSSKMRSFGANGTLPGRQFGTQAQNRNGNGFRPVSGEIVAADSKSMTVKLADGSSKIVILSEKTTINKASAATSSDVKVGDKVAVFGTDNSDGSVTAQSVQLNPEMQAFGSPKPQ